MLDVHSMRADFSVPALTLHAADVTLKAPLASMLITQRALMLRVLNGCERALSEVPVAAIGGIETYSRSARVAVLGAQACLPLAADASSVS